MCGWGYSFSMLQMFVLLQRWHFAFRRMPTMLIYVKIAAEYSIFRRPRKKKYAHRNYTRVRRRPQ